MNTSLSKYIFYASINVGEFNLLEPNIKFANLRKTNKA